MEITNFKIIAGSAPRIRFRLVQPEDVTNWTTQFTMWDVNGTLYQTDGVIADPNDVPNSAKLGVFDVPLSRVLTSGWTAKVYSYAFWRTNSGFEDPLASGEVTVKKL